MGLGLFYFISNFPGDFVPGFWNQRLMPFSVNNSEIHQQPRVVLRDDNLGKGEGKRVEAGNLWKYHRKA